MNDSAITFRNVLILPMDSQRVLPNQTVVVKQGKISAIDDVKKVTIPSNAVVIDGSGSIYRPD